MATNYNEQSGQGQYWQRCNVAVINNPLDGVADITFHEQSVIRLDNGMTVKQAINACRAQFDAAAVVPVVDPSTGQPTGETFTHGKLYQYIYSLYIQTAQLRDQQVS